MNLHKLTKREGKLIKFIRLAKKLQANSYGNILQSALRQEGCQVVFFSTKLQDDYLQIAKRFSQKTFYLCLPDELTESATLPANIPVLKLSALKNLTSKDKVLILTRHEALPLKFWDYFRKLGMRNILLYGKKKEYRRVTRSLLLHSRAIYAVYNSLDQLSQNYYASVMCGRLAGDIRKIKFAQDKQYFLDGFMPEKGDVVIDGGAYDGMTAKDFCDAGCKVYSFEMDQSNYQKAIALALQNNFVLENMGLGLKKIELKYSSRGTGSCIEKKGSSIAHIIDIDTYAHEKGLARIDFIKMDIEGSEMAALQGAADTIRRYKPKLAICLYHKLSDMWEIPKYLKQLRPDYQFAFRHYPIDGGQEYLWNEQARELLAAYELDYMCESIWESVLYCR